MTVVVPLVILDKSCYLLLIIKAYWIEMGENSFHFPETIQAFKMYLKI